MIMKTKKILIFLLTLVAMLSVFAVSASANNHTDVDFILYAFTNPEPNTYTAARLKKDTSSSYVNYTTNSRGYAASGPYKFEAFIYGSSNGSTFVDCSSYTYNNRPRSRAIITKGTKGFIRQDVYERFGYNSYAQIWAKQESQANRGTAMGCWSADSVGTYNHYNHVI